MAQIRALVVDDQARLIESMRLRLGREIGWEIDWTSAASVDDGLRLMASAAAPFDLVIADLMFPREDFPDEDEPRGLELIRDASQRSRHTFILAISTGSSHLLDLMDQARQSGAHHVVRRNEFSTASVLHSPLAIAGEVREHLLDNGTVPTSEVVADPRDPGIQGLLNRVGKATVARLYAKVLSEGGHHAERIELRFLPPGASGAAICTVTAQVDGVGRMSHILKLSQAQLKLEQEAERGHRASEILPQSLLVHHHPSHVVGPVNGWYALSGPLVERAAPLRDWLLSSRPEPATVTNVLETLFVDGLGRVYAEGRFQPTASLGCFTFTPYRQQCILQVLGELEEALERRDGGGLGTEVEQVSSTLRAFVAEGVLPGGFRAHELVAEVYACYQHGDLHADNVLVATGVHQWPLLIDTSHSGWAHWATDPARLAVDLLMRGVDAGTESMLFTGFPVWRTLASRFGAGEPGLATVTAAPGNPSVLAALSWLATNLHRVTPVMLPSAREGGHRWEWHLLLARSLLRSTYHPDIPHAKRALAFAAAYDQLVAAAAAAPR